MTRGFSLIEILVVSSVIVLIGVAAGFSLFGFNRERDLINATLSVTAYLRDAQQHLSLIHI